MPSNSRPTQFTETALQSTGAYELVFSALIVGFFGYGVDQFFGTSPFFVIAFSIFGFLGASALLFYRYKHQVQLLRDEQR